MSLLTVEDLYEFDIMGDEKGLLIALESNKNIPFDIKRVFYIYDTIDGISRGNHAHYITKQLLVCINGSCKVELFDGDTTHTYILNKPNVGLFQDAMVWGKMYDFSKDCVLMVLANTFYNEKDYIRDFDTFLKEIKKNEDY